MYQHIKGYAPLPSVHQFGCIKYHMDLFHGYVFGYQYKLRTYELSIIQWLYSPHIHLQVDIMDPTHYWPFAQEYSIWNATVTSLQFWTADHEQHFLINAMEWVYTAFFHSNSAQQIWNLPEEVLFGHLMTTLNNTFDIELTQEDEGYESESDSLNIPTPLRRVPGIYHILTREDLSFNPTTPLTRAKQQPVHSLWRFICCSLVCCHLVFSSFDEESPVTHIYDTPVCWMAAQSKQTLPFTNTAPCESPPHIHTKYRSVLHGWHNRRKFSHSSTRWWCLVGRPNSR